MFYVVYDPHGEMFEVPAVRLNDLIVVRQWTFWHPSEKKEVFRDQPKKPHEDDAADD